MAPSARSYSPPARWLGLWAVVPAVLLAVQVQFACGIVYSLDDPYIHLALARQILHGHYGINPGEFTAPASSILWPFLLAPFAFTPISEFLPLAINLVSLAVTVWWLQRWLETWLSSWWALAATTALAFAFNFYGLVMTGMENSLQVMLTVIVAISLVGKRFAWPFWLGVIFLPFIRYEGLAISLPTLAWLVLAGEHRGKAIASGIVIAAGVGGFSLFLYRHGVGFLPASVLAKNGLHMMETVRPFEAILDQAERLVFFLILAVLAAGLAVRRGRPAVAVLLIGVPAVLHLLFGKYGWFGRYHIYFVVWISILFIDLYAGSRLARLRSLAILLALGLAWASIDNMIATLTTPLASRNISDQQKQMAIIARDYLDEPVAVNDLGFVSYYARHYVLDLGGLASFEVLWLLHSNPMYMWLPPLLKAHKVEQVMIFDDWFASLPPDWIRVATLDLPLPQVSVGSDHVVFYSTSPEAAARLRKALGEYRKSSRQAGMMVQLVEP